MTANAEIIAELRRVLNERDEARAEVERLRAEADRWKRSCNVFRERDWPKAFQATVTSLEQEVSDAHEQLAKLRKLSKPWEGDGYRRERDDAREQLYLTKAELGRWVDRETKAVRERDEARAEVERLRVELIRAGSRECDIAACNCGTWHHQSPRAAYRRGAEAMREACARWISEREGISQWVYDDALSALPIPEEP